jgi:hypothetical protein
VGISSFPQQFGEALSGALGESHTAAIPASDQMGNRFSGRGGRRSVLPAQHFKRLPHYLGFGAPGLSCDAIEISGCLRIDSDI